MQSKADSDEDGDSETVIGKAPPKNKNILCILWWIRKIQRTTKSGYNAQTVSCGLM